MDASWARFGHFLWAGALLPLGYVHGETVDCELLKGANIIVYELVKKLRDEGANGEADEEESEETDQENEFAEREETPRTTRKGSSPQNSPLQNYPVFEDGSVSIPHGENERPARLPPQGQEILNQSYQPRNDVYEEDLPIEEAPSKMTSRGEQKIIDSQFPQQPLRPSHVFPPSDSASDPQVTSPVKDGTMDSIFSTDQQHAEDAIPTNHSSSDRLEVPASSLQQFSPSHLDAEPTDVQVKPTQSYNSQTPIPEIARNQSSSSQAFTENPCADLSTEDFDTPPSAERPRNLHSLQRMPQQISPNYLNNGGPIKNEQFYAPNIPEQPLSQAGLPPIPLNDARPLSAPTGNVRTMAEEPMNHESHRSPLPPSDTPLPQYSAQIQMPQPPSQPYPTTSFEQGPSLHAPHQNSQVRLLPLAQPGTIPVQNDSSIGRSERGLQVGQQPFVSYHSVIDDQRAEKTAKASKQREMPNDLTDNETLPENGLQVPLSTKVGPPTAETPTQNTKEYPTESVLYRSDHSKNPLPRRKNAQDDTVSDSQQSTEVQMNNEDVAKEPSLLGGSITQPQHAGSKTLVTPSKQKNSNNFSNINPPENDSTLKKFDDAENKGKKNNLEPSQAKDRLDKNLLTDTQNDNNLPHNSGEVTPAQASENQEKSLQSTQTLSDDAVAKESANSIVSTSQTTNKNKSAFGVEPETEGKKNEYLSVSTNKGQKTNSKISDAGKVMHMLDKPDKRKAKTPLSTRVKNLLKKNIRKDRPNVDRPKKSQKEEMQNDLIDAKRPIKHPHSKIKRTKVLIKKWRGKKQSNRGDKIKEVAD